MDQDYHLRKNLEIPATFDISLEKRHVETKIMCHLRLLRTSDSERSLN